MRKGRRIKDEKKNNKYNFDDGNAGMWYIISACKKSIC